MMVGYYWYGWLLWCVVIETPEQTSQRVTLLEKVAEACAFQGSHHLAAKKFTQAGNKVKVHLQLLLIITQYCQSFTSHRQ